jgi:hypothetical protein
MHMHQYKTFCVKTLGGVIERTDPREDCRASSMKY